MDNFCPCFLLKPLTEKKIEENIRFTLYKISLVLVSKKDHLEIDLKFKCSYIDLFIVLCKNTRTLSSIPFQK